MIKILTLTVSCILAALLLVILDNLRNIAYILKNINNSILVTMIEQGIIEPKDVKKKGDNNSNDN